MGERGERWEMKGDEGNGDIKWLLKRGNEEREKGKKRGRRGRKVETAGERIKVEGDSVG